MQRNTFNNNNNNNNRSQMGGQPKKKKNIYIKNEAQEGAKCREKGEIGRRSDRERGLMLWINETKER